VLILDYLDRTALGYYGIGLMAVRFLYILPRVVWETMYPRFGERYGEAGSPAALERLLITPLAALALVLPILLGGLVIALPIGLAIALPDYIPGLAAGRVLIFGSFFLGLLSGPGNFVHTISKRQAPLLLAYALGLGLALVLIRGALLGGLGITGVALATFVSYGAVTTAVLLYVFSFFFSPARGIAHLLRLYTPFVAVASVVAVSEHAYPTPAELSAESIALTAGKLALYGILAASMLFVTRRHWLPFLPLAIGRPPGAATVDTEGLGNEDGSR
jgi:O-antigen/teichoic acid export membrane protein